MPLDHDHCKQLQLWFDHLILKNLQEEPTMTPDPNDQKLMTKRIQARDRTTVILSYTSRDAQALRAIAQTILLKRDKRPSLSLLCRRALQLYGQLLASPVHRAAEIAALNKMVTAVPAPAPHSKRLHIQGLIK
jgi:hypothetical protein